jgi:hypothetical protein
LRGLGKGLEALIGNSTSILPRPPKFQANSRALDHEIVQMKFSNTTSRSWLGHGVEAHARAMTSPRTTCAHPDGRRHGESDLSKVAAVGIAANAAAPPSLFNRPVASVGTKVQLDHIGPTDGQVQPAKTADRRSQFLQIVAKSDEVNKKKGKKKQQPKLTRVAFKVSRLMEFCTRRETRRYMFSNSIQVIDLGLRLGDIEGLEQEPAAATKTNDESLRDQLSQNGATPQEIEFLLNNRVELNAMASDQLVEFIERKLEEHGVRKVVPGKDLLGDAYQAFHRSRQLQDIFEKAESEFEEEESEIDVPDDLESRISKILKKNDDLRWDDAVHVALDETQLDHVRGKKKNEKDKAGNFADANDKAQP